MDARELEGHPTGVGRYLDNLLEQWRDRDDLSVTLYSRGPLKEDRGHPVVSLSAPNGTAWLLGAWPRRLLGDRPDVVFGPGYCLPPVPIPGCVAIHDLSYEVRPDTFTAKERLRRRFLSRWACGRARAILCMSPAIAREIEELYRPAASVTAVPHGIDAGFSAPADPDVVRALRERLALAGPLVLFIGSVFQRRHPEAIFASCARVFGETGSGTLVVAGENRTAPRVDLERLAPEIPNFHHLSRPDDRELRGLLELADVMMWPSDYEGFGLPPLEALAAGTPVISTRRGVLEENLAGAAVLVEENNVDELAEALGRILRDGELRERLVEEGRSRAARFSWESCAERTLETIRGCIGT